MKSLLKIPAVKQFLSYFCVGGVAAIVEWILFSVFANVVGINYVAATCLSFIFSTATNLMLGRRWTFKNNNTYESKKTKEIILVFSVSAIGLLFNIGLMYLFVEAMGLNTATLRTFSKCMATGIVFIWNFFIRKYVIYR